MNTETYTIDEVIEKSMEIWFNEYAKTPLSTIQNFDGRNVQWVIYHTWRFLNDKKTYNFSVKSDTSLRSRRKMLSLLAAQFHFIAMATGITASWHATMERRTSFLSRFTHQVRRQVDVSQVAILFIRIFAVWRSHIRSWEINQFTYSQRNCV